MGSFSGKTIALACGLAITCTLGASLAVGGAGALATAALWATVIVAVFIAAAGASLLSRELSRQAHVISQSISSNLESDLVHRFRSPGANEFELLTIELERMRQHVNEKAAERNDENEQLRAILQGMSEGVLAVDPEHRVLHANEASRRLLRFTASEIDGRTLLEVTRIRPLHDAVVQVLSRPGPVTTELTVGNDSPQHMLLRAARLPGEPCPGVVLVLHDVTEVRRLEGIRKEFVANVSHELKTPVASIKAYAETLRMGAIDDAEHNLRFVERIEQDADRLNGLIADMLQIARIESHKQAFNLQKVDVGKSVEKCVQEMAGRADAEGIELKVTPADQRLDVLADEDGVHTILANLVDNAIKYTPEGGTVRVQWAGEANEVILEVIDTGMGIEAEHQERIFERFFRVDRARTRDSGGTGLGLSIVKHLVQAFDGSIGVNSTLGKGSRFSVRLPAAQPQIPAD